MYQIFISIYLVGVAIASIFSSKVRKMWRGERCAIRTIKEKIDPDARYIWFHAASLGEFEQGRPIMEHIKNTHPEYKILLTFFSPSGYEVRKNYEGADIICYLPIDTIRNARRFLRAIRPEMAFFIKYEFWYNYLHILQHRGIPVYSVSSIFRPGQIFFRWYGWGYKRVLRCFTHFFVQNERSKQLLQNININCVTITGDTRFDRVLQIAEQSKTIQEVEWFKDGHKTFIAGSSWLPDEEVFLPYLAEHKDWKVVIAPHVIADSHLSKLMPLFEGRKVLRFTKVKEILAEAERKGAESVDRVKAQLREAEVMIIDCFGLLSSIYKYGDVAYIGGGFGVGIHNLLEAAVWNIPVIFGPNHERFQEAMQLKDGNGGYAINGKDDFVEVMKLLSDDSRLKMESLRAGNYVIQHSGATKTICASVF